LDLTVYNSGHNSGLNQSTLIWAIICSILLHVLLAVVLPNFKFDITKAKPQPLTIEIMQPEPPAPVALPEPIAKPEPIKPEPIKKPELIKESKPITETVKPVKQKSAEPAPIKEVNPEPATAEPPPPNVIATAPKVDPAPEVKVAPPPPQPEPPKKIEPSDADVSDARAQYGNTLGRAIAKHKSYPKIAQMRGWQGEVLLDLKLDGSGNVQAASIKESSGHESLDNQALEMVRKASPFPAPPEALRGRSFNITVPVSFKLENA
jgi:periplasmic protein TonB